ncbi:MAG: rhamnose/proton symporter RhaT [Planctomycetaceae bacterium]|nr:rhamnose/proton symporter RhaT [Planctomycetaceae bacterium]MBP63002.1 rhamnose/proton symporter RhaT [Planctomycetaceae bacterium]
MSPFLGVIFHAVGGFAAGSFYIPFKRVREWSWETYWLVGGLFIWIICPLIAAAATVPGLLGVYRDTPRSTLLYTFLFGVGWGIGHLTFGLSLRYLGMSLGMGMVLGYCTFFGALLPTLVDGTFSSLFFETSGRCSLAGIMVCLMGVFFCSWAGMSKERELTEEVKKATISEFNFFRGVWVACFSGVMSACFAFGVTSGGSLTELAETAGAESVYANNAPLLLILSGGGLANIIACLVLNVRNGSTGEYVKPNKRTVTDEQLHNKPVPLGNNYLFCTLAGVIAYAEFFFFGMGESQMGDFSLLVSWPIHMAFIIVFSNIWGIAFREWQGTSPRTKFLLAIGLLALLLSTMLSAYGTHLNLKEIPV